MGGQTDQNWRSLVETKFHAGTKTDKNTARYNNTNNDSNNDKYVI